MSPTEYIVDNVFDISKKAVKRVSGRRCVESAVDSDEPVLEFLCNLPCPVDRRSGGW